MLEPGQTASLPGTRPKHLQLAIVRDPLSDSLRNQVRSPSLLSCHQHQSWSSEFLVNDIYKHSLLSSKTSYFYSLDGVGRVEALFWLLPTCVFPKLQFGDPK